jgi:hypothetical protein
MWSARSALRNFLGLLKCSGAAAGGRAPRRSPERSDKLPARARPQRRARQLQEIAKPMGLTLNGVDVVNVNDLEGSFSAMGRFASPTGS